MPRLLIADDHMMFRVALRRLLSLEPDFEVVAEAGDDSEVIAFVRNEGFSIAILDLSMGGRDGFELIARVKSMCPKLPILILSAQTNQDSIFRALRAGADGYITKFDAPDQLVTAVRRLATGGKFVCARMAECLANGLSQTDANALPHTRLSNREYKVFEMIVSGKSMTQIAKELILSVQTVSTHKTRLMQKMALNNLSELIQYAVNNDLLPGATGTPNASG